MKKLIILLAASLFLNFAWASDHGGGGGGGELMKFTVNIGSPQGMRYLQVEMMFETGSPEAAHEISTLRPRVQHALILLLSSKETTTLLTRDGKHDLMEEIAETVNHIIEGNHKTGVKEVLFTSFIIQ